MPREPRRRVGVRVRITAFATLIVAAALVAGALLLTGILRARLDDAATTAAALRARDIAGLATSGGLPSTLALPGEESAVVQVVSADGAVIASSGNVDGEPAVSSRRPAHGHVLVDTVTVDAIDDQTPMRLVGLPADTAGGPVVVYSAESLERSDATVRTIAVAQAITIPVLLALVAGLTWWAVGRTLRPVRTITNTLADITTTDLHRRVPQASTNDEIGLLADTVNDTLGRLEAAVERQRRFTADASHELRGPLAALRGDLEISLNHPGSTDWRTVAADTLTDVDRLQQLTDDLLTLARLGADPAAIVAGPVDLGRLVSEECSHVQRADLAVDVDLPDTPVFAAGSATHLRRLVRNLLHNAEMHATGRIGVHVGGFPDHVEMRIDDDGPGIPAPARARVFEPFVRLDTARTRDAGGTGLGLAIVGEIVHAHHGDIHLGDNRPSGLVVTVRLPVARR